MKFLNSSLASLGMDNHELFENYFLKSFNFYQNEIDFDVNLKIWIVCISFEERFWCHAASCNISKMIPNYSLMTTFSCKKDESNTIAEPKSLCPFCIITLKH